jgi:hypothetical protein
MIKGLWWCLSKLDQLERTAAEWNEGKPDFIRILCGLPFSNAPLPQSEQQRKRFLMSAESRTNEMFPSL